MDVDPPNTKTQPPAPVLVDTIVNTRTRDALLDLGAIKAPATAQESQHGTQDTHLLAEPLVERRSRLLHLILRVDLDTRP
eukprot:5228944-Alexandrium_andersonii.AAC.1